MSLKTTIPGHFFNSEHSPYLFPMFNFKKHRSNALWVAMQPTIPNTRDFEIMLKIVPIDGIGVSCVALEMSRTFLMLWLAKNNCIMCISSSNNLTILLICQVPTYFRYLGYVITCIHLCFLKLNIGNKYELCSMLKKCPGISCSHWIEHQWCKSHTFGINFHMSSHSHLHHSCSSQSEQVNYQ
jgi:hypothetical protein